MTPDNNLPLSELTALSPLDGRYRKITAKLSVYLSEFSLVRVRAEIECAYLIALSKSNIIRKLNSNEIKFLESIGPSLSEKDILEIKDIENKTKHDVKSVELFLRKKLTEENLNDLIEMIHFGLTSEDINNLSYRIMLRRASENIIIPSINEVLKKLIDFSNREKFTPMLARTHGQPAVPTTLGKEIVIFADRISNELSVLKNFKFSGKLSGAVGNFNSMSFSYPDIDWIEFSKKFLFSLSLKHNMATSQINTYEDIIFFFQTLQRINSIIIDLNQDIWRYISDGWFIQEKNKDEVGSSTMPQKINPILFENSEGNLGLSNGIIDFFIRKLPVSRLQRDLSDSTVIRNFGPCIGYCLVGYENTSAGLNKIQPNHKIIEESLLSDWSILSEAAQTILRKNNVKDSYLILKNLTRGEKISEEDWKNLVNNLEVNQEIKNSLLILSPKKYIGIAPQIVSQTIKNITSS